MELRGCEEPDKNLFIVWKNPSRDYSTARSASKNRSFAVR
jgi:hypothetical protein